MALRGQIEHFIEGQREGYAHLLDPKTGTFVFGWDATADRFVGWEDGQGNWVTGQMNYFINEFRGPWTFVVLRYGLPVATIRNAGFKIKPYRQGDGSDRHALAAWDGSAFQLLGLSLFMQELGNSRLETQPRGPGGHRAGLLGPQRAAGPPVRGLQRQRDRIHGADRDPRAGRHRQTPSSPTPRPSIPLGSPIRSPPRRWSGFSIGIGRGSQGSSPPTAPGRAGRHRTDRVIPYQTTVHTLALILGGIGTAQENMRRYLEEKGLQGQLETLYAPGDRFSLLAQENEVVPWTSDQSPLEFSRGEGTCRFASHLKGMGGVAFIPPAGRTVDLSNGRLVIRYRSETEVKDAAISFKRAKDDPLPPPAIPIEIITRFKRSQGDQIAIVLPATPALSGIGEVALTFGRHGQETPVDISILGFDFIPFDVALDSPR